jgi:hypothetical protein
MFAFIVTSSPEVCINLGPALCQDVFAPEQEGLEAG